MAKLIQNMFDTQTNPGYGGTVKGKEKGYKKITSQGPQNEYSYQKDYKEFNRGAESPWMPPGGHPPKKPNEYPPVKPKMVKVKPPAQNIKRMK
jgi:hypothetical protein